jgi:hypothetical protein
VLARDVRRGIPVKIGIEERVAGYQVVDQDVDGAGRRGQPPPVVLAAHVGGDGGGRSPGGGDLRHRLRQRLGAAAADHHVRPGARQRLGELPPDPGPAAGDQVVEGGDGDAGERPEGAVRVG